MPALPRLDRRGTYSTLTIFSLPVFLGIGAITVDLGYQRVVAAELQAAADLAVLAGSQHLDGTAAGVSRAREAAGRAAARNTAGGRAIRLSETEIEFGAWDEELGLVSESDPSRIDGMKVRAARGDLRSSFAHASFGVAHIGAGGQAIGMRPPPQSAGAASCYIPLAVARCQFDTFTTDELVDKTLVLNPAGVDNVGWGRAGASPNASWLMDQIGDCTADGVARVGETVGLQNGEVSSALGELVTEINASETSWDSEAFGTLPAQNSKSAITTSNYGNVLEGPIIVFDGGPEYCTTGGDFNGEELIVGFAWAVIYDVRTSGGAKDKNIWVKLKPMADQELGFEGGGLVDAGVLYQPDPVRVY